MPKRSRKQPASTTTRRRKTVAKPRRPAPKTGEWSFGAAARAIDDLEGGPPPWPGDGKDPLAVALGRRGGLKGGKARAEKLTPAQRRKSALKAAQARWGKRFGKTK